MRPSWPSIATLGIVLSIALHAPVQAGDPADSRSADPTRRLAILAVLAPRRDVSGVPLRGPIVQAAKRVLEAQPGVRARTLEELDLSPSALAACPASVRLRCLAHAFDAHDPDYLILIALYPRSEGIEWLSTLALDVKIAHALEAQNPSKREAAPGSEALEDSIFTKAARVRSISLTSADDPELEKLLGSLLSRP